MSRYPDPNQVFPNEYGTTCFLKNVITAPNITVGDYTYYDDAQTPTDFEKNNVLFNWPEFGAQLVIGKFCSIASGVQFLMGPANHRISSVSTYPFSVFGGAWAQQTPPHLDQLPRKGDIVVGNDVWLGRDEGTRSKDGKLHKGAPGVALIAAKSKATVIPVAIQGTFKLRPFRKITLIYGKPMTFEAEKVDKENLQEFTEKIMQEIASMLKIK